jgi:LuxR family maltose regulon positive regulatory protein
MTNPLISTKYCLPPTLHKPVIRQRLLARMDCLLLPGKRLALVSALAGAGKTTLVRSWVDQYISSSTKPLIRAAWLSLDEEDNDLAVFLAYFVAALKAACPEIDMEPITEFEPAASFAAPLVRSTLARVVNLLAGLTTQVIVVLDDYHNIALMAIHEAVTFLLDHLPESVRIVIITRAESLLPVSRLRARGQLIEIREADLRFTADESTVFFNELLGLNLYPSENEQLVERTEGWAVGLQMAALALKALPDPSNQTDLFVRNFSGSHRFVLDYLMDEVFARLPAHTQYFLLHTAILDRFNADLCSAVIGETAIRESTIEPVDREISTLSNSHLFIIPLDEERCWYRYHHLFTELLRNRLRQDATPGVIAEHQRRAGDWFAERGIIPEAIHYLLLAGNLEQATDLIEAHAQEVISNGRLTLLNQWLAALPAAIFTGRPRLRIFQALTSFLRGDAATTTAILEDAGLDLEGLPEGDNTQSLKRELVSILAMSSIAGANSQRILSLVEDTLGNMPETELIPRARLLFAQGMTYAMSSDKRYYILIKQALDLARKAGDVYLAANILNMQAMGAIFFQAQVHSAWELYAEIIQMCSPSSGEALPFPASLGYIGQAAIALEWNDLDQAASLLDKGVELCRQVGQVSLSYSALLVRARLMQARGDFQAACAALEEAVSNRTFDDNIAAAAQLAQAQVRLYLEMGQVELATQCASGTALPPANRPGPALPGLIQEVWIGLHARALLAQDRPAEALALLDPIIPQAKSAGRMARVVEGSLWQALAFYALKQDALGPLLQALAVSQPQGLTRLFLEAGQQLRDLLVAYRPRLGTSSSEADRLLYLLGEPSVPSTGSPAEMVEPLTPREMDVLRLLCEGRSNQEMAATLFLSLSAIKKYTGNLYGKLGVTSRAQAIIKAHELRLV